jgi:heme/copper-type cytochrome/quinol oxidase subunit 2
MIEWLCHLVRQSVDPRHATAWLAVQMLATVLAFAAAGVYVVLTYLLWRQNHRAKQAVLMQQLMVEYDGLRDHI